MSDHGSLFATQNAHGFVSAVTSSGLRKTDITSAEEETVGGPEPPGERVLFVCTGNRCRSPMAEVLLRAKLAPDCGIGVASAGTVANGEPPPEHAVRVMAVAGLDIEGRPSRRVDVATLEEADLIITMAQQHLVEVVTMNRAALERSFTFVDLIRRARQVGRPTADESLSQWAQRLSAGRTPGSILSLAPSDDIVDPMGGSLNRYKKVAKVLDHLTGELAVRLFGSSSALG